MIIIIASFLGMLNEARALMFDDNETSDESGSCSGKSCVLYEDEMKPDVSYCTSTSRKWSLSGEEVSNNVTSSRLEGSIVANPNIIA